MKKHLTLCAALLALLATSCKQQESADVIGKPEVKVAASPPR